MSDDSVSPIPSSNRRTLPDALRPHMSFGEPDEAIAIYQGPISYSQAAGSVRADAIISLIWLPLPAIHLDVPSIPDDTILDGANVSIRTDDGTVAPCGLVSSILTNRIEGVSSTSMIGFINGPVVSPADGPVTHVMFLLPNFDQPIGRGICYPDQSSRAARLILQGSGWVITLDATHDERDIKKISLSKLRLRGNPSGTSGKRGSKSLHCERSSGGSPCFGLVCLVCFRTLDRTLLGYRFRSERQAGLASLGL